MTSKLCRNCGLQILKLCARRNCPSWKAAFCSKKQCNKIFGHEQICQGFNISSMIEDLYEKKQELIQQAKSSLRKTLKEIKMNLQCLEQAFEKCGDSSFGLKGNSKKLLNSLQNKEYQNIRCMQSNDIIERFYLKEHKDYISTFTSNLNNLSSAISQKINPIISSFIQEQQHKFLLSKQHPSRFEIENSKKSLKLVSQNSSEMPVILSASLFKKPKLKLKIKKLKKNSIKFLIIEHPNIKKIYEEFNKLDIKKSILSSTEYKEKEKKQLQKLCCSGFPFLSGDTISFFYYSCTKKLQVRSQIFKTYIMIDIKDSKKSFISIVLYGIGDQVCILQ